MPAPKLFKGDWEYYGFVEVLPGQGQFVTFNDRKDGELVTHRLPFITRPNIQSRILDPYAPSGKAKWVGRIELNKDNQPVMFIRHLRLLQRPPEKYAHDPAFVREENETEPEPRELTEELEKKYN